jgi:hypothetical protein
MDSLKFHPGPSCPAGGPCLKRHYGCFEVAHLQARQPAAVFYPFGHPWPYRLWSPTGNRTFRDPGITFILTIQICLKILTLRTSVQKDDDRDDDYDDDDDDDNDDDNDDDDDDAGMKESTPDQHCFVGWHGSSLRHS